MKARISEKVKTWGGISLFSGIIITISLAFLIPLPNLRGPQVIAFLASFLIAAAAYFIAVIRLGKR